MPSCLASHRLALRRATFILCGERSSWGLFGKELHPSIAEKAAAIGWRIIAGHVFHDRNKRTGMEAYRLFLDLNGYILHIDREAVAIALKIATGEADLPEFAR